MTKLQPAPTELTVPLLSMCVWLWRLKIWKMELRNIVTSAAGPSTHECMSALYNIHPLCVEPSSLSLLVVVLGHGFMTPPNLIYQTVFWPNFVISFVLPNFFFTPSPFWKSTTTPFWWQLPEIRIYGLLDNIQSGPKNYCWMRCGGVSSKRVKRHGWWRDGWFYLAPKYYSFDPRPYWWWWWFQLEAPLCVTYDTNQMCV